MKTCTKKRKDAGKDKGKADEVSKRSRLALDPEQYMLDRISEAQAPFGCLTYIVPDTPVSPICTSRFENEEMSIDSSGEDGENHEDEEHERQFDSRPPSPIPSFA
jgi:hypothetical protein